MRARSHSFRVGISVYGIVPRLLLVSLVTVGAIALVPFALWQGVAIVAALVSVVVPRTMAAWIAGACLAFGVLLAEPSVARTALAILLVHSVHVLGSLSLVIPVTSRLSLRVLLPSLVRLLGVQLIAQPIAFGAWLLAPQHQDRGIGWLAPVAAAALLTGVVIALRALKKADPAPQKRPTDANAVR